MNKDILVTGAYGYIGSHICKFAYEQGYNVWTTDLAYSSNNISRYSAGYCYADIRQNEAFTSEYFNRHFYAVIHCAAKILVEESTRFPSLYFDTNVSGTVRVINNTSFDNFIFASTGGAFDPISPYAKSKVIAEEAVRHMCKNYNIFRFFNVAGNNGEFGQICTPSHIIHIAAQVAAGKREKMTIFGNNFDTRDGTCIRDYVHVQDVAEAIVQSIEHPRNRDYECIGTGTGHTNLEVVKTMQKVSGVNFPIKFGPPRQGDPAILKVDSVSEFMKPRFTLEDMCRSAYEKEVKNG